MLRKCLPLFLLIRPFNHVLMRPLVSLILWKWCKRTMPFRFLFSFKCLTRSFEILTNSNSIVAKFNLKWNGRKINWNGIIGLSSVCMYRSYHFREANFNLFTNHWVHYCIYTPGCIALVYFAHTFDRFYQNSSVIFFLIHIKFAWNANHSLPPVEYRFKPDQPF